MNRYPLWVYVTIGVALVLGALYTLPNFFGEAPAVQVSPARATLKVDSAVLGRVEEALRNAGIQPTGISLDLASVKVRLADTDTQLKAKDLIERALNPDAPKRTQELALKQNIQTLHNRINELGVAEPVIQQQGSDRVVVQLPGVQDTAKAKEILGRTATLEVRMVDEDNMNPGTLAAAQAGQVPFGDEFYIERNGQPLLVRKQVVLTGDRLTDAQPGFDNQTQEPAVHLTLDATGARIFKEYTRENVGKRMAILLIEKGRGEVVTAPVIRSEIGGGRVQISGRMTTVEANDIALLLRAGALAAPMEIVEERTVGPSLGAENIRKGFDSTVYGFAALSLFIIVYYSLFGA